MAIEITREQYRDKVHGAWLGKNAGQTLGAPLEGKTLPSSLRFYDPKPGQPAAFDGIDVQLLWLHLLREREPALTSDDLASAFHEHIGYVWDEYGWSGLQLRRGLRPPITGSFNNWFRHGVRGVSRCDLWALMAPGDPQTAAIAAWNDAVIDHAEEGAWAAMLWAAMESAAFVLSDLRQILDVGLAMVPENCRVARAVRAALGCDPKMVSWLEARDRVIAAAGSENWSDAPQNAGFATLGLLYGGGDFGQSLLAAVNVGYAAQTNGGAVGALLGIMKGQTGLPADWLAPIGEAVVMGWGLSGIEVERTVGELVDHTVEAGERFVSARCAGMELVDQLTPPPVAPAPPPEPAPQSAPEAAAPTVEPAAPAAVASVADDMPTPADSSEVASRARFLELDEPTVPEALPSAAPPAEASVEPPATEAQSAADAAAPALLLAEPAPAPPAEPAVPPPAADNLDAELERLAAAAPAAPPPPPLDLKQNAEVRPLLVTPPNTAVFHAGPFELTVDYGASGPVILPGVATSFTVAIRNTGGDDFIGHVTLGTPDGWEVRVPGAQGQRQMLARGGMARYGFALRVPDGVPLSARNTVKVVLSPEKAAAVAAEIPLLGGSCWWFVGPFKNVSEEGYDYAYEPEDRPERDRTYLGRDGGLIRWQRMSFGENVMNLEQLFNGVPGVAYGTTTLHTPVAVEARIVAACNDGVRLWLNGQRVLQRHAHASFRPSLASPPGAVDVTLKPGDNQVTLKVARCGSPLELAFAVTDRDGKPLLDIACPGW